MTTSTFRKSPLFRYIAFTVLTAFVGLLPAQPSYAQVAIIMPPPGEMIHITNHFEPPQMIGLKIDIKDPFSFDFIMDQGESSLSDDVKKEEFNKIVKYFLVALAMPNKDMWVNLSPYESNRLIPEVFAQTEMGRDLLAQDYVLKQFTASLMYPENGLGKKFWDRVYQEAQARFGTTEINVNTFNKVWIVADHADVYQKDNTAFLVGSHLKVMLEQDYMAIEKNKEMFGSAEAVNTDETKDAKTQMASQLVREIIIPAIEKEVNEGKSFAAVRQVYNAEIMATWFKKTLRQSLLGQVFANKSKIAGQEISDPQAQMEKIYHQYLRAYKKGVFNYIREDETPDGQTIPRKYFSGGMFPVGVGESRVRGYTEAAVASLPVEEKQQVQQEVGNFAQLATANVERNRIFDAKVALLAATGLGLAALTTPAEAGTVDRNHDLGLQTPAPIVQTETNAPATNNTPVVQQKLTDSQHIMHLLNTGYGVTVTTNGWDMIVDHKGTPLMYLGGGVAGSVETATGVALVGTVGVPATVVVGGFEYGLTGAKYGAQGGEWVVTKSWDGTKWVAEQTWDGTKWVGVKTWDGTKWVTSKTGEGIHTIYVQGGKVVVDGVAYEGNRLGNAGESVFLNAPVSLLDILPGFRALTGLKTDHEKWQAAEANVRALTLNLSAANQSVTNLSVTANQNAQAYADAQQQVTDLTQQLQAAKDDLTKASAQYQSNFTGSQGSSTNTLANLLSTAQTNLNKKDAELRTALDDLRNQKAANVQEQKGLTDKQEALEAQILQNDQLKGKLNTVTTNFATFQTQYQQVQSQLVTANGAIQDRDTEIGNLKSENEKNQNLNKELAAALGLSLVGGFLAFLYGKRGKDKIQADLDASNKERDRLQASINEKDTKAQEELARLSQANDELQRQKGELEAQIKASAETPASPTPAPIPTAAPAPSGSLKDEIGIIDQQIAQTQGLIDGADKETESYQLQSLESQKALLQQQRDHLDAQLRGTPPVAPAPTAVSDIKDKVSAEIEALDNQQKMIQEVEDAVQVDLSNPINSDPDRQNWFEGKGRKAIAVVLTGKVNKTGKEIYEQLKDDDVRLDAYYVSEKSQNTPGYNHQQVLNDFANTQISQLESGKGQLMDFQNHLQKADQLASNVTAIEQKKNSEVSNLAPADERAAEFYKIRTWKNNGENISWEQQQKDAVEEIQELSKSTDENLPVRVQQAFEKAKADENDAKARGDSQAAEQAFPNLDRELAGMIASEIQAKYKPQAEELQNQLAEIKARQAEMEKIPEVRAVIDRAALAEPQKHLGGINLSDENLTINIKVDGAGMPLPAQFQDRAMMNLSGLTSVIRKITPMTPESLPALYSLVQ